MPGPTRVLVVEDHDDSRELLAAVLRRSGFEVTAYDRCEAAERHLEACDVDVALLDVRLPDRRGDDFGRDLRARCPNTMIVFVTGESLIDPLKVAVPDCFVIRKPIDVAVLLELLSCFGSNKGHASPAPEDLGDRPRADRL